MERRKHRRFIKRLRTTLIVDDKSFIGFSGDLSESGLFIRTNRSFAANTPIEIEILLPDNRISSLKGFVRRTHISPLRKGMGIEIVEKDMMFSDLLKSVVGEEDTDRAEKNILPDLQTISCLRCKSEDEESHEKRRHRRFPVKDMKVDGAMPAASDVEIINVSMSGVLVKADRTLDIGNKYALKIGYKEKVLFAKAVVIWSLLSEGEGNTEGDIKPVSLAGMQFTDVTNGTIEEIVNFIEADMLEGKGLPGSESQNEAGEGIEDPFSGYENSAVPRLTGYSSCPS